MCANADLSEHQPCPPCEAKGRGWSPDCDLYVMTHFGSRKDKPDRLPFTGTLIERLRWWSESPSISTQHRRECEAEAVELFEAVQAWYVESQSPKRNLPRATDNDCAAYIRETFPVPLIPQKSRLEHVRTR